MHIDGVRFRLYAECELRHLSPLALRSHAESLHRVLSRSSPLESTDGQGFDEIVGWVLEVQRCHLEPLIAPQASKAWTSTSKELQELGPASRPLKANAFIRPNDNIVITEAHSMQAQLLSQRHPQLAVVVQREIRNGCLKFNDGFFGADAGVSQRRLAEDIYTQLDLDTDGFFGRDRFVNFSVAVGPIAYAGSIPCFCYKVGQPRTLTGSPEMTWITVFYTLSEAEQREIGRSDHPSEALQASALQASASLVVSSVPPTALVAQPTMPVPEVGAIEFVSVGDVRLPLSSEAELRQLDHVTLRERADLLVRGLEGSTFIRAPGMFEDMVAWILRVQRLYLEPLLPRWPSRGPWPHELMRLPVFSELMLRSMDRASLREHACLLYSRIGAARIGFAMPSFDRDLVEWILRVQRAHLGMPPGPSLPGTEISTVTTDRFGNKEESRIYTDMFGDEVATTMQIDRWGDCVESTTVRDCLGEKVTTKTRSSSPQRGNRLSEREETKVYKGSLGNSVTTRTITDSLSGQVETTTTRCSNTLSGNRVTTETRSMSPMRTMSATIARAEDDAWLDRFRHKRYPDKLGLSRSLVRTSDELWERSSGSPMASKAFSAKAPSSSCRSSAGPQLRSDPLSGLKSLR